MLSHGAGCLLSCIGFLHIWETYGNMSCLYQLATLSVYAAAWVFLYGTSTLYHASRHLGRKAQLRVLDHCAIFVVIAASYGPFVLNALDHRTGYTLWVMSWMIAIGACIFKDKSQYRYHVQSTWAYIAQGWMVMLTLPTLLQTLTPMALFWLVLGGVFLTGGTYFYIRDDVKYNHGAWHLCVLLGSFGFYLSILELLRGNGV